MCIFRNKLPRNLKLTLILANFVGHKDMQPPRNPLSKHTLFDVLIAANLERGNHMLYAVQVIARVVNSRNTLLHTLCVPRHFPKPGGDANIKKNPGFCFGFAEA